MTKEAQRSLTLFARLVWGRLVGVDEELVVLGELTTSYRSVRGMVAAPSGRRFEVTVRYVGDRELLA